MSPEIAKARTFGFLRDVEKLQKMGLVRGGSLSNAVVFDDNELLNVDGFRYADECVRHKILDFIGDLALTGVPVLLNTSFNVRGEPIVETPRDAVRCFLATGIDYLVLHDLLISKRPAYRVLSPIFQVYADVNRVVRVGMRAAPAA